MSTGIKISDEVLKWIFWGSLAFIAFLLVRAIYQKSLPELPDEVTLFHEIDTLPDRTDFPEIAYEHPLCARLLSGKYKGAVAHLEKAHQFFLQKEYTNSVVESIHAVESIATHIVPSAKTLSDALKKMDKQGDALAHPAFRASMEKLYAYTNDEAGLRHANNALEEPNIGEDEAYFFLNSCFSSSVYLVNKSEA